MFKQLASSNELRDGQNIQHRRILKKKKLEEVISEYDLVRVYNLIEEVLFQNV